MVTNSFTPQEEFSTLHSTSGQSGTNSNAGKTKKKKKKYHASYSVSKPLCLLGKTGIAALHELCDKRHWDAPKFVVLENTVGGTTNGDHGKAANQTWACLQEFGVSVQVNGRELGCGRSGTKKGAQQDAARRALSVLFPAIVFDSNGILVDIGDNAAGRVENDVDERSSKDVEKAGGLEELVPNLASRLAIDTNNVENDTAKCGVSRSRCASPTPSEDSSISTAVSMGKGSSDPIISGGPLMPQASTTSGISSASEDDEYLASRGASICSALLHAMAQIDERIREPPTYIFDICENPATQALQQQQERSAAVKSRTKRKGRGFGGYGGAITSKRRSATNEIGRRVTIPRCSFACTASILLYNRRSSKQRMRDKEENLKVDPLRGKSKNATNDQDEHDIIIERLEVVSSAANKRDARHTASAKLLALLFPECSGMTEVKEAAEALREKYAASKALSKQNKRINENKGDHRSHLLSLTKLCETDPPLPEGLAHRLRRCLGLFSQNVSQIKQNNSSPIAADSLAKLSISDGTRCKINVVNLITKACENKEISRYRVLRQRQLEELFDSAIQSLHDSEDDRGLSSTEEYKLGQIVLRRATSEDSTAIHKLLIKSTKGTRENGTSNYSHTKISKISPVLLFGGVSPLLHSFQKASADNDVAHTLWGCQSVVVVIVRAVASYDEPPLGFAVLSLSFSTTHGRIFRLSEIAHEEHFPRERFNEILYKLGEKLECHVEKVNPLKDEEGSVATIPDHVMRDIIQMYTLPYLSLSESKRKGKPNFIDQSTRTLDSVKEEENEDEVDDKANEDQNCSKRLKLK